MDGAIGVKAIDYGDSGIRNMTEKKSTTNSTYKRKTGRPPNKKRKFKSRQSRYNVYSPRSNVNTAATLEDLIEAERQINELSYAGTKSNGEKLRIVMIQAEELKLAGYRLAVGGDKRKGRYYTVRDDEGFFTLDGVSVFCLKGNQGRKKLQELVDKGFFDSPRLEHKDKL